MVHQHAKQHDGSPGHGVPRKQILRIIGMICQELLILCFSKVADLGACPGQFVQLSASNIRCFIDHAL